MNLSIFVTLRNCCKEFAKKIKHIFRAPSNWKCKSRKEVCLPWTIFVSRYHGYYGFPLGFTKYQYIASQGLFTIKIKCWYFCSVMSWPISSLRIDVNIRDTLYMKMKIFGGCMQRKVSELTRIHKDVSGFFFLMSCCEYFFMFIIIVWFFGWLSVCYVW